MKINILVTLDANYLEPLKVMLGSLFINNPGREFNIYMIADNFSKENHSDIKNFISKYRQALIDVSIEESMFANAPATRYYSKAMYYRLLAGYFLPADMTKILYIDPDILAINSIDELYNIDLENNYFAAASHFSKEGAVNVINKMRLADYEAESYYNSGVLLMDLNAMRKYIKKEDIFKYIEKNENLLILPDQDVLNALYGSKILRIDDSLYNYDARHYEKYLIESYGLKNMDWLMDNTVLIHFCGKNKPWSSDYDGRFSSLYKHYQRLKDRTTELL